MSGKPKCRYCGKRLYKYWQVEVFVGTAKQTILERKTVGTRSAWARTDVWCGGYGYLGNNFFCSKSCGYYYAVRRLSS